MHESLKSQFLIDPGVVFLNHGSFGACPNRVFEAYQRWQRELERQPVEFIGRRGPALLAEARARLAAYLGAEADELAFFPNPTTAVNMVARSLLLQPGDEVLTTDHEYGAMDRTWRFLSRGTGWKYVRRSVPLPLVSHEQFVDHFWAGVTERTRVVFISHITSPTGVIFPVGEICRRAREAGVLSIVDGAHAPGQIPLNLSEVGADFYTGACHKWLCAPKGSAFLYARREVQPWLQPLVVSWGWGDDDLPPALELGATPFSRIHEWQGTRDLAPFLATPAAIDFQAEYDWEAVRAECHALASETRRRLDALTGLEAICPDSSSWYGQMATIRLPPVDVDLLKQRLYDEFRIEVPVGKWNEECFVRVSYQGYNTAADAEAFLRAMEICLRSAEPWPT